MIETFTPYAIFEHGSYIETVLKEENGVRIVHCTELGISKLYRIEYGKNFSSHTVRYDEVSSLEVFTSKVEARQVYDCYACHDYGCYQCTPVSELY